jgi:hypothetical protein
MNITERSDPLEKDYRPVERCHKVLSILFWVIAGLTIFNIYQKNIIPPNFQELSINISTASYIVLVMFFNIIFLLNRFYYTPRAESKRRQELLSNAFDIRLTTERTNLYYNNPLSPSVTRLGLNVFENTHYGKTICGKMAEHERVRVVLFFAVWTCSAVWRHTDLQLLGFLFQVIFSTQVALRCFSIEITRAKFESLFNQLHTLFLDSDSGKRNDTFFIVNILAIFAEYESAKAAAMFKQSSKLFKENNDRLSAEWATIKKELNLVGESI